MVAQLAFRHLLGVADDSEAGSLMSLIVSASTTFFRSGHMILEPFPNDQGVQSSGWEKPETYHLSILQLKFIQKSSTSPV
jgi:hypothetical protein